MSGSTDVTYEYADMPDGTAETFPVEGYTYMGMNYVLTGVDKTLVDVTFDYAEAGPAAEHERTFASVPVQRNYRTNIYGSLLTNQVDFNVIVDPQFTADYNTPNYVYLKGETSLQDYVATADAATLANTDLDVDLQSGTLKADAGTAKQIVNVNCKSISISNGKVTDTGLSLTAADGVSLSNVEIDGTFIRKQTSNASVSINTPGDVVVDGVEFTNTDAAASGRYNGIEINLNSKELAKNVTVKNCKFAGLSNNAILVFGMPEGGVVNVENCQFDLADGGEAVRISNKTNTQHFTINAKNCNYTYPSTMAADMKQWLGFFVFEDYTSKKDDFTAARPLVGQRTAGAALQQAAPSAQDGGRH